MSKLTLTPTSGAPTSATAGAALRKGATPGTPEEGFDDADFVSGVQLLYRATVTAGQTATMSFLRLWVYSEDLGGGEWYPLGAVLAGGTDADRGKVNGGVAFGEIDTDKIQYTAPVPDMSAFSRVYLEQGTSGGAGYSASAVLRSMR